MSRNWTAVYITTVRASPYPHPNPHPQKGGVGWRMWRRGERERLLSEKAVFVSALPHATLMTCTVTMAAFHVRQ